MAPVNRHPAELLLKAQGIRMAFFGVDGVLTDGGVYFASDRESGKRFHAQDGYGLELLTKAGIVPVILSGRDSKPVRALMQELGIAHAHFGVIDKRAVGHSVLQSMGLQWNQAAAMGDDWPDLPLMRQCAFSAAPPSAHAEILARADYASIRRAGEGAVRDVCDLLLTASGRYAALLQEAGA